MSPQFLGHERCRKEGRKGVREGGRVKVAVGDRRAPVGRVTTTSVRISLSKAVRHGTRLYPVEEFPVPIKSQSGLAQSARSEQQKKDKMADRKTTTFVSECKYIYICIHIYIITIIYCYYQ